MTKFTKLPREHWFNEDIPSDSRQIDELRTLSREASRKFQQRQTKDAGKKSAATRRPRARVRLRIVELVYARLDAKYKHRPYSKASINALRERYCSVVRMASGLPHPGRGRSINWKDTEMPAIEQIISFRRSPKFISLMEDAEFCLLVSDVMAESSLSDRLALEKVSCETLRKCLAQLGVKAGSRSS
jgi:hypothetical protein